MSKRLSLSLFALAALAALLPAAAAAERYEVATGVGYRCVANTLIPNQTLLLSGEEATDWLRIVPGGGKSVIGGWGAELAPGLGPIAQQLVVFEPLENGVYRKVAESRMETLSAGSNGFPIRIPVDGGELVGLYGPGGTLACNGEAETFERTEAVSLRSAGSVAIGGGMAFATESGLGTPVQTAVVPDRDGDGWGDHGEDRCEGTGSRGSDCPIRVRIGRTTVKERAILVEVTPAKWARIELTGSVYWNSRTEDGLLISVDLDGDAIRRVPGGRTAVFRVPLPKSVLQQLERRDPRQSMLARLGVLITDRDGWESGKAKRVAMQGRR